MIQGYISLGSQMVNSMMKPLKKIMFEIQRERLGLLKNSFLTKKKCYFSLCCSHSRPTIFFSSKDVPTSSSTVWISMQHTCTIMMRAQLRRMRMQHQVVWGASLQLCRREIERTHGTHIPTSSIVNVITIVPYIKFQLQNTCFSSFGV